MIKFKKNIFNVCLFGCAAVLFSLSAAAQVNDNFAILNDRMDRLERDMTFMQRRIYQPQEEESKFSFMGFGKKQQTFSGPIDQTDELYSKLTAQEEALQRLTARVETQNFEISKLEEKIAKMNADMDIRFKMLEDKATSSNMNVLNAQKNNKQKDATQSMVGKTSAGSNSTTTTSTASASKNVKEQYDAAYGLLKKGDHVGAEKGFIAFIEKNPKSDLAGNANYWLGETYYARGQYEQAVGVFAEGFTTYKSNSKAPDNLLKLGMSMAHLKKKDEACTAFKSLPIEFPKANAGLKKRAQDEAKKLSCP